eukprot:580580-Prymnesium_polylepis.1
MRGVVLDEHRDQSLADGRACCDERRRGDGGVGSLRTAQQDASGGGEAAHAGARHSHSQATSLVAQSRVSQVGHVYAA